MKKLCLIRHAKTSWSQPTAPDRERPLEEKGVRDTEILGDFFKEQSLIPDLILASPAIRTHETAKGIAKSLSLPEDKILINDAIYNARVEDLLEILSSIENNKSTVFLVGHNPSISLLANYLADSHIPSLTTTGAFALELNMDDWSELTLAEAKILFHYHPSHDE